MGQLDGKKILMFVHDIYEDLELWYPLLRFKEEGADVVVAGPEAGQSYASKHGYPCTADVSIDSVDSSNFDALVIPGGFAPDKLRRIREVLDITADMHNAGKPIAHICHAGWVPISAGIMRGFTCTSTPAIKDDLINAGAEWIDASVVIDRNMITSRNPGDLPDFCRGILKVMADTKVPVS